MTRLNEEQIERYSRQMILPEVGGTGQEKLLKSRVLLIGAGGLGAPCALYLAAAGIGHMGLLDSDHVELNNLQRQIIHSHKNLKKSKVESAKEKIQELNPEVSVETYADRLTPRNALSYITPYDFIIDGSDNFETKFLVNDVCLMVGKPFNIAGLLQYTGQVLTVLPGKGPCYRCIFPTPPDPETTLRCQDAGILGSVAGVIGTLQATETLKYFLNLGDLLVGRLLTYDAKTTRFKTLQIQQDPTCAACRSRTASIQRLQGAGIHT